MGAAAGSAVQAQPRCADAQVGRAGAERRLAGMPGRSPGGVLVLPPCACCHATAAASPHPSLCPAVPDRLQEATQEAGEEGERLQQQLAAGEISVEAFVDR